MITDLDKLRGRKVGVLGLGKSGLATVRALRDHGALPVVFDDNEGPLAIACALGAMRGDEQHAAELEALVVSPGVALNFPRPHRIVQAARHHDVPIIADLDLFQTLKGRRTIIGITGTNGKSTTSALVAHLIDQAGGSAILGGNIGTAVLDLDLGSNDQIIVLELSSYQLDLVRTLRCNIAVWLNISPDHLDRHGGMEGYVAAKEHIFDRQGEDDAAVICIDDDTSRQLGQRLRDDGRRVITFSGHEAVEGGVGVRNGMLIDDIDGMADTVLDLRGLVHLRGSHNHQNAAAAYAALRLAGFDAKAIGRNFASFGGLAHRAELILEACGIHFINDSKATNPASTIPSLEAHENIFWLAGGRPKDGGFKSLAPHLASVRRAYFFGAARDEMIGDLSEEVEAVGCNDMEEAFRAALDDARRLAIRPATILLAPACASFDQFTSFEARGEAFRTLVKRECGEVAA